MKRLAIYILAIYTMALSCIPCQDEVQLSVNDHAISTVSSNTDQEPHSSIDLCSPFCICACCAGITLQQHIAHLPEKPSFSFPKEQEFSYVSDAGSGNLTSIWQPPRI